MEDNTLDLKEILEAVENGTLSAGEATEKIRLKPFDDLGYAKVDLHRKMRQGASEVIYGEGKTAEQIAGILKSLVDNGQKTVLITRLDESKAEYVKQTLHYLCEGSNADVKETLHNIITESKDNVKNDANDNVKQTLHKDKSKAAADVKETLHNETVGFTYYKEARIGLAGSMPEPSGLGKVVVATGGTSDVPVAEEAAVTLEALGNEVVRLYDVGVAGIHRLIDKKEEIMEASVIIAIAGMEGALASVIGGLADCPVIAVPTSVGYGAAFEGLTALLSMLNSCASGVSVVNIDNGFGAGYMAHMINHMEAKRK